MSIVELSLCCSYMGVAHLLLVLSSHIPFFILRFSISLCTQNVDCTCCSHSFNCSFVRQSCRLLAPASNREGGNVSEAVHIAHEKEWRDNWRAGMS